MCIATMKISLRSLFVPLLLLASAFSQEQTGNAKAVGTVQSISGNTATLKTDAGAEIAITVEDATRVLRSEPGQKSLKEATPIQFSEIQTGDRTLASGKASADGKTIAASTVVVMKQSDIASKQEKEKADWQHRGVGGLVSGVDAANNTVTISTMAMGQKKEIVVHVSPATVIRRYAPDSVKFDDAKKSTLAEINPGDQLRARGSRNPENTAVTAEEIVSGAFRNLAGTVQAVDKSKNQLTLMDLATKKPVTVVIASDSQMRKLPEMMAQRIAARLKGTPAENASADAVPAANHGQQGNGPGRQGAGNGGAGGAHSNGGDVLQMILSRAPAVQLTDLQKGDAVMLVATQGSGAAPPTAITLLAGVEPILSASPKGSDASTILSPWNLGGTGGGDASAAQ
jgi:hypothetical protein